MASLRLPAACAQKQAGEESEARVSAYLNSANGIGVKARRGVDGKICGGSLSPLVNRPWGVVLRERNAPRYPRNENKSVGHWDRGQSVREYSGFIAAIPLSPRIRSPERLLRLADRPGSRSYLLNDLYWNGTRAEEWQEQRNIRCSREKRGSSPRGTVLSTVGEVRGFPWRIILKFAGIPRDTQHPFSGTVDFRIGTIGCTVTFCF